jgi:hypothetical protein
VSDPNTPDSTIEQAEPAAPSLATRILHLQEEHRALDQQIAELYDYAYRDQLLLQRLKKKKLRIKDTIERLKDDLIPDLNA